MPAPLSTEKVIRTTLKALRFSGLLTDEASINTIMETPNNATDVEIDARVATLSYGNMPGVSQYLASEEDFTILIDSDGLPSATHENFFRIGWGTNTLPVTSQYHELFTVGRSGNPSYLTGPTEVIIGPRNDLMAPATQHTTLLHMAATSVEATPYYGDIKCGPTAVGSGTAGMGIYSKGYAIEFLNTPVINVRTGIGGTLRGGWTDTATNARFQVGDHENEESLAIEVEEQGGLAYFNLRTTHNTAAGRQITLMGSNYTVPDANPIFVAVGGDPNEVWGLNSAYDRDPNLLVITPTAPNTRASLYVLNRCLDHTAGTQVVTIETEATFPSSIYYMIRMIANAVPVFNVQNDGVVNAVGGFVTGPADLAEWMPTDQDYDPGTVLVIRGGVLTKATSYESSALAGVVSTQPGFLLNQAEEDVKIQTGFAKVAISGTVPVKCSTARGDIHGNGELLISGPDGHAVLAPDAPRLGTVIGKAMGSLVGNGVVKQGMVEVFVNLQ